MRAPGASMPWRSTWTRLLVSKSSQERMIFMKVLISRLVIMVMVLASVVSARPADLDEYMVTDLTSVGGTIGRGNSINNNGWITGYSNTTANSRRHAALWINGGTPIDLGSLGGPNGYSSVA